MLLPPSGLTTARKQQRNNNNNKSTNKKGAQKSAKRNPTNSNGRGGGRYITDRGVTVVRAQQYKPLAPKMKTNKDSVIIKHTEFVDSYNIPVNVGALSMASQHCNPANVDMFPWLSLLAQAYEKFKIHKMSFRYQTATTTLANGSAYIYIDYDPTDPAPTSLQEMAQASSAFVMKSIYSNFSLSVIPSKFNQPKSYLINSDSEISEGEILLSYPFRVYYGIMDSDVEQNPGYLYIDYEIELMTPTAERIPQVFSSISTNAQILNGASNYTVNPNTFTITNMGGSQFNIGNSAKYLQPITNGYTALQTVYFSITVVINASGFDSSRGLGWVVNKARTTSNGAFGSYYREIKDIALGTDTWIISGVVHLEQGDQLKFNGNLTDSAEQNATVFVSISSIPPAYWNSLQV